jgi:hypothetical protein
MPSRSVGRSHRHQRPEANVTPSLNQLIAISLLLTVAEKVLLAGALSLGDIDLMRIAVDHVRTAFAGSCEIRSEVNLQA